MISRRGVVWAGVALGANAVLPGSGGSLHAQPAPSSGDAPFPLSRLRGGEILSSPDFSKLAKIPYRHGIRPHRKGGVRLEAMPPVDTPSGPKYLIHNYGHGGGGITLSFGCAGVVKDHVARILERELRLSPKRAKVAVVGAGVIGLTVASELKRWRGDLKVAIYARNVDARSRVDVKATTSWVAGGQFEPSGIWKDYTPERNAGVDRLAELHALVRRSADRIKAFQKARVQRDYGIVDRNNYELQEYNRRGMPLGSDGFDLGTPRDVIPEPAQGTLPFAQLCNIPGREYRTWLMNPTLLLPKLAADLRAAGARFVQRSLVDPADVLALDAHIIVNCTGLGAKALFNDDAVVPIRGQLVILQNANRLKYMFSGGCADDVFYLFARQDDIVIGGTYEVGVDVDDYDEQACTAILERARAIFAGNVAPCGLTNPAGPCATG